MTSINPINVRNLNNEFGAAPATAPKGKPDAGKSTLAPAEDTRTWWQWITFVPKPEPKVEPKPAETVWYMIPFNALYNLGLLIVDGLKAVGNGLVSLFHYVTCGCFKAEVQAQAEVKKIK